MNKYRVIGKKGEGTFSEVLKAQCTKNGRSVAIKCMKNRFESVEQVNRLREIQALRRLSPHENIIKLLEVLFDRSTGRLALVFELMDCNIYELIRGRRQHLAEDKIKLYMYQLLKSMDHMHRNGIFHRDIKPENILIQDDVLKLADFGSCRGVYSKQPFTEYISTRWYRAPECLLTDGYYNYKMDLWGVGCVFFEIVSLYPLFPGTNELDQIHKIHNILGAPAPEVLAKIRKQSSHMDFDFPQKEGTGISKLIPHASTDCLDLMQKLLAYLPDDRISARAALRHPYFKELREEEKRLLRQSQTIMSPASDISLSPRSDMASPHGSHQQLQFPNNNQASDQQQQPSHHKQSFDGVSLSSIAANAPPIQGSIMDPGSMGAAMASSLSVSGHHNNQPEKEKHHAGKVSKAGGLASQQQQQQMLLQQQQAGGSLSLGVSGNHAGIHVSPARQPPPAAKDAKKGDDHLPTLGGAAQQPSERERRKRPDALSGSDSLPSTSSLGSPHGHASNSLFPSVSGVSDGAFSNAAKERDSRYSIPQGTIGAIHAALAKDNAAPSASNSNSNILSIGHAAQSSLSSSLSPSKGPHTKANSKLDPLKQASLAANGMPPPSNGTFPSLSPSFPKPGKAPGGRVARNADVSPEKGSQLRRSLSSEDLQIGANPKADNRKGGGGPRRSLAPLEA